MLQAIQIFDTNMEISESADVLSFCLPTEFNFVSFLTEQAPRSSSSSIFPDNRKVEAQPLAGIHTLSSSQWFPPIGTKAQCVETEKGGMITLQGGKLGSEVAGKSHGGD